MKQYYQQHLEAAKRMLDFATSPIAKSDEVYQTVGELSDLFNRLPWPGDSVYTNRNIYGGKNGFTNRGNGPFRVEDVRGGDTIVICVPEYESEDSHHETYVSISIEDIREVAK